MSKNLISQIQKKIDLSIRSLGGYWRPLSALARLMEELGEFASACYQQDNESSSNELTDIFIISTCIANQYCSNLSEQYKNVGFCNDVKSILTSISGNGSLNTLLFLSGKLARRINHYEGDKTPKNGEDFFSVQEVVAEIHIEIFRLSKDLKYDFIKKINNILDKSSKRDKFRFNKVFDPSASECKKVLIKLNDYSDYVYDKVWGAPEWDLNREIEYNTNKILNHINRYKKIAPFEKIKIFILVIPDSIGIDNYKKVLKIINDNCVNGFLVINKKIEGSNILLLKLDSH
ncbi:MAG: hypothetical protein ACKOAD_06160 [Gammaproteobacteria bacterium]